ncbi:hypothetical protein N431DRAFT_508066 [Stipitochalara longipes BDJ]|nr:hypothetical protein N431DRAFT_508066 [Stipitochalara longipes BDJ]
MGYSISTLKARYSSLSIYILFIALASQFLLVIANEPFKRADCAANITKEYQDPNGTRWNSSIISSVAKVFEPVLTLYGCEKLCGSGTGWYPNTGPRLVGWFLPIFLLVSNMQFPRISTGRFFLVLHLLGDPIDSTWSLLHKVDSWRRCYELARERLDDEVANADIECLAIIYATRVEVENASYHQLAQTNIENMALIRTTASKLIRQRTNENIRTGFAVAMYMFQVVSDFVPEVGASSDPSGGMIGPAMLLSWLVPVVLLSNAIGDSGSPASTLEIMAKFTAHNEEPINVAAKASLVWSGSSPSYHPNKGFRHGGWILAIGSVVPVVLALGTAFAVLQAGPTHFSCRSLFVIGASACWGFSAVLTYVLSRKYVQSRLATEKYLWRVVLIKDFLVATPILVLIVVTSCGYWNTCYCWCGGSVYGENALCPLNPTNVFSFNDGKWYPAIVAIGLGLQVMIFLSVLWLERHGFMTMGLHFASSDWPVSLWKKIARVHQSPLSSEIKVSMGSEGIELFRYDERNKEGAEVSCHQV